MGTIMKKMINEIAETIEDLLTLFLSIAILIFAAGAYYGSIYAGTPQLWWPAYLFIAIVVLKFLKDMLLRVKDKVED